MQFGIDENGILEVLARDVETGQDTVVRIQSAAVDVDDERVEEMVSESVEHAFEDMSERIFTEARLKAEELLPAVDMVLKQGTGLVSGKEAERIQEAAAGVRNAMELKEANRLKAAVQELDKATEGVAARLVERAMEEAMARKMDG